MQISLKRNDEGQMVVTTSGKQIAKINPTNGIVTPLRKLTKLERSAIDTVLDIRRLRSYGDPRRGSIEAKLEKMDEAIGDFASHFEALELFPELVDDLDAAGTLIGRVSQALREARGHGEPEWEPVARKAA